MGLPLRPAHRNLSLAPGRTWVELEAMDCIDSDRRDFDRLLLKIAVAPAVLLPSLATVALWSLTESSQPILHLANRDDSILFARLHEVVFVSAIAAPFAVGLFFRKVLRAEVPVAWLTFAGIVQFLFVGYGFMWAEFAKGGGAC